MEAARAGAAVLLKYWERIGKEDADIKARNDWVSKADRESELAIVKILRSDLLYPCRCKGGDLIARICLLPRSSDLVF